MIGILLKQPLHIWRTLEKRHKLEAILLAVLIISYLTSRLNTFFAGLLNENATISGVTLLVINVFTLQISLSSLAVVQWVIPRQTRLRQFLTAPLSNHHLLQLLTYSAFKYLSAYLILIIPVVLALASFDLAFAVIAFVMIILLSISYLWCFFLIKQRVSGFIFVTAAFLIICSLHCLFGLFYWSSDYALTFQTIYFILACILILSVYNFEKQPLSLERFIPYITTEFTKKQLQINTALNFKWKFLPAVSQSLYEKESLALWRNQSYRKLKLYSFLAFIVINSLILISSFESKGILIILLTALLIWIHYSNGFNEKYIFADPDWFIRTLPIRFRQLMLAKYFAEIPFVFILCFLSGIFLLLTEPELASVSGFILLLLIFSHVVLFTMLNFQIMFYNDPRLAGYAYHFTLLFVFIMILNYRLVGPVIALGLMIFFLYKNVKYFNN